jgi:hypothetical protein
MSRASIKKRPALAPRLGRKPHKENTMGLWFDEKNGDVMLEGTVDCLAVLHKGGNRYEVWDTDAEAHYGSMPADSTAAQINAAVSFYNAGLAVGRRIGIAENQRNIRSNLGLN